LDANQGQSQNGKQEKNRRLLAEGKKLYLKDLEGQIKDLELAIIRSLTDSDAPKKIYRLLNTIKGTAPVFDFAKIGHLAEKMIRDWEWTVEDGQVPSPFFIMELSDKSQRQFWELQMEFQIKAREMEMDDNLPAGKGILVHSDCRLLVIDDDEMLRTYMVRRMEMDGYQVDHASTVTAARQKLWEQRYDLVTLDLIMYPQSGYELFDFLKGDPSLKWVPLIVLSGRNDLQDKVRCFHLGADDYVTKPFQYEELAARIYSLLIRTKSFAEMAFRDPLTGVNNRRYFDHQVQTELQRIGRYPTPLSIVFIDIDRFKNINDTYGHHIGDLVLQGLAFMLQKNLRASDFLARFGGEEFVVVLPNTSASSAFSVIQNILEQIQNQPIIQHEGVAYSITFSAGIAEYSSELTKEQWIKLADEAMYRAKNQGRNRVLIAGANDDYMRLAAVEPAEQRKCVLIADDDSILRSMLTTRLKQLNLDVMEAQDGVEAYQLLQSKKADLCIFDSSIPKLSGFELLQKIKSEDKLIRYEMKTIMLSGRQKDAELAEGLQLDADDYVIKPFSLLELEIRIKQLLSF
jgi:two-component system cell cycle response regulator